MNEKPTVAFAVSLIGGIFVILGGLLWAALGTLIAFFTGYGFLLYGFLGVGFIIVICALLMNTFPSTAKLWGIILVFLGLFSLIGIVTALGGLLTIIGGAIAISWKPMPDYYYSTIPPQTSDNILYCTRCGSRLRYIPQYKRWYCENEQKYV